MSIAIIRVCDYVCVCRLCACLSVSPRDKTKTAETLIAKIGTVSHRDSPSRYLAHQLILGQKVKGQGHRVTKCKKAIEWPVCYALYRVPSL